MYVRESRKIVKWIETTKITNWMTNTSLDLYMRKVNGCFKDISLRIFLEIFYEKKNGNWIFLKFFLIFSMKVVLKFSENVY